jgi:DNA polymerase-1
VPAEELTRVRDQVPGLMTGVAQLKVPLVADIGVGDNWDKAHL